MHFFLWIPSFVLFIENSLIHFFITFQDNVMLKLIFAFFQLLINQEGGFFADWKDLCLTADDYFLLVSWPASFKLLLFWFFNCFFVLFIATMLVLDMGVHCSIRQVRFAAWTFEISAFWIFSFTSLLFCQVFFLHGFN